jgi:hypothetical protein
MYSKRMFLTLEKIKKKKNFAFEGILVFFTWVFCIIKRVMRGVLVFLYYVFNFLIEKLMTRVLHAPVSGWCLHHSGGACDTTRWPNLAIHHLSGCVAVSSSTWCDVCGLIMVRLPPIIDFFLSFLSTDS